MIDFCTAGKHQVGPKLACASLLKPLYAWLGEGNQADKQRAVQLSDNAATSRIVGVTGGLSSTLDRVHKSTGINWRNAPSWGSVQVNAQEVFVALSAMAASNGGQAVLDYMRKVPVEQQLGLVEHWAQVTDQPQDQIGVKLGWDLHLGESALRTHAALIGPTQSIVIMSAIEVDQATRDLWHSTLSSDGPAAVLPIHERVAGDRLRSTLSAYSGAS